MHSNSMVLISRTDSFNDLTRPEMKNLLMESVKSGILGEDIYIILKATDSKNAKYDLSIDGEVTTINLVHNNKSTGPTSINSALDLIRKREDGSKPDAFLVVSKEVSINSKQINKLREELESKNDILVVGYKFKHQDSQMNQLLRDKYDNEKLAAYAIPWNTCAIWKYDLFSKYVGEFDEITENGCGLSLSLPDRSITSHKGMEDGLAIAKALSGRKFKYKLINEFLDWGIGEPEEHRKKLERKETVLCNYIATRGYRIDAVLDAKAD